MAIIQKGIGAIFQENLFDFVSAYAQANSSFDFQVETLAGIAQASPGYVFYIFFRGELFVPQISGVTLDFIQFTSGLAYCLSGLSFTLAFSVEPAFNPLAWAFGDNAQQTETELKIQKADLTGIIPLTQNTAESLLVAILVKVLEASEVPEIIFKRDIWGIKFIKLNQIPIKYTALEFEFREVDNG